MHIEYYKHNAHRILHIYGKEMEGYISYLRSSEEEGDHMKIRNKNMHRKMFLKHDQ